MQAAVFHGIEDIRIETVPTPEPGPDEAVMRVGAAGICGTDLRIYGNGHHRIPEGQTRILGHELAGEIVAVGANVTGLVPGMRVGVAPNMGCGTCPQCVAGWTNLCANYTAFGISLNGAFAEYMLITKEAIEQGNVVPIPAHVSMHVAALAEPLSCVMNGQEAVNIRPGDTVMVVGAGPIGLMHVQLAKISGARRVIMSELSDKRLNESAAQGADVLINPGRDDVKARVLEATDGEGANVVIIAAPAARAQEEALDWVSRQGRINLFGGLPKDRPTIQFNSNLVHYKQLMVTGTTGSNVRQYRASMGLIIAGRIKLDEIARPRLPLVQIHEGIVRSKSGQEMRVLIEPSA